MTSPENSTKTKVRIREAVLSDAAAIAKVRVASWRTTYHGLINQEYLDNLDVDQYTRHWEDILEHQQTQGYASVAVTQDDHVVGFALGGPERSLNRDYRGELYAIYLLDVYQGQGIGKRLAAAIARRLLADGIDTMLVWVLSANPARYFYEALGGKMLLEKEIYVGSERYPQVAYGFNDIRSLATIR